MGRVGPRVNAWAPYDAHLERWKADSTEGARQSPLHCGCSAGQFADPLRSWSEI